MTIAVNPEQSTSRSRSRRTDAAARSAEALALRLTGLGYAEIAERLDYRDKSGAWRAVEGELKKVRHERASEVVALDLTRLDMLLNAVWGKASAGDPPYVDRALKILERRAKYFDLDGRADSTSEELRVERELGFAATLARLAEIQDRMAGQLSIAIPDELSRLSKGLPVRDIPWETAMARLDAFTDDDDECAPEQG